MHDPVTETVDRPLRNIGVPPSLSPGAIVDQRYQIERVLGYGGSAVVYAARDLKLKVGVALKILRSDRLTETAVKRLRREVAIARKAADPHLLRVFDIVESDDGTYLTMELFDAPTLRTWMKGRPLEINEVIRIASEILGAMAALHELGIVHRDIKPSNILIGPNGEIKLGDFGLALHLDPDESRLTQNAGFVGTLEYLSPEQALGTAVDQRSDLYSFGVLLFEMLTGKVPFESDSSIGTVVAHVNRRPPDVRRLRPETPRWLARVIAGLLEKDRSKRFPTAEAVRTILDRRRLPFARALPWLRVAAATAAVLAFALAGGYWWFSHRFARLVNSGTDSISALDRRGRLLWSMRDVKPTASAIVHQSGSIRFVAVMQDMGHASDLRRNHALLLLSPQSGEVLRRIKLPDNSGAFPEFSPEFHIASMGAADLRGNGDDVVVVSYVHVIYWPSYTVIYDPREQAVGTLFIASGHHRFVGAADVNGDGRKEVILSGINNRMGWNSAVAAIDVRSNPYGYQTASSPDTDYVPTGNPALVWYSLLPAGHGFITASVDPARRRVSITYSDGRVESVGFDGFPVGTYRAPLADRERSRRSAFGDLREAGRLSSGGFESDAIAVGDKAVRDAEVSEDPYLIDWARRTYALILTRAGRLDEAERVYQAGWHSSSSPSEVAFDAGRAFHLAGALDRAVSWYNQGLGLHASSESGRGRYEFLEGEVLALGELKRWDDALAAIRRFEESFREAPYPQAFRNYIQWRSGEPTDSITPISGGTTDLVRYWNLELLNQKGAPPAGLLDSIDEERRHSSGNTLLLSLRGEVLARLGRLQEAYADARKAFEAALVDRQSDTAIRAHFVLITARYARLARAIGRPKEAKEADARLRAVRR